MPLLLPVAFPCPLFPDPSLSPTSPGPTLEVVFFRAGLVGRDPAPRPGPPGPGPFAVRAGGAGGAEDSVKTRARLTDDERHTVCIL